MIPPSAVWPAMRREAQELVSAEPVLGGIAYSHVLNQVRDGAGGQPRRARGRRVQAAPCSHCRAFGLCFHSGCARALFGIGSTETERRRQQERSGALHASEQLKGSWSSFFS